MPDQWFCVNTKARNEDIALRHLTRQGFIVLFPQFKHARGHRVFPLFPGYLFVNFDVTTTNWRCINGTIGVQRILTTSPDKPAPIPDYFIEQVQRQIHGAQWHLPVETLQVGDNIEVSDADSHFYQFTGTIVSKPAKERIEILLGIFGRDTKIQLPTSSVKKI